MYKKILIPIAPDHQQTSAEALVLANKLADPDAELIALSVVEDIPHYVQSYLPPDSIENNISAVAKALAVEVNGTGATPTVVMGHSAQTILDWAENHDVDLIVIASHRPGLQDYFLGSTAARVVRHAQCAVPVLG